MSHKSSKVRIHSSSSSNSHNNISRHRLDKRHIMVVIPLLVDTREQLISSMKESKITFYVDKEPSVSVFHAVFGTCSA